MNKLVTIAVPVYKRLHYLPNVLKVIASQDYPEIELIVSDNGINGPAVQELIRTHYSRPYRFRQNLSSVSISSHFNQLVREASGEYFVLLADDDEISPNYVSELTKLLDRNPQASVAISKQEIMDESGVTIRGSKERLPEILPGPEFIRAAWDTYEYQFECFATFLTRTEQLKSCGGYPDFCMGHGNDDALLVKLCLNHVVVLSDRCTFRFRLYESSHGWSSSILDLAEAYRQFFQFLDSDPTIQHFTSVQPAEWKELKQILAKMVWRTYHKRWKSMYRQRLTRLDWLKAAFAMPFMPAYYGRVLATFFELLLLASLARGKRLCPRAYEVCKAVRYGRFLKRTY